MSSQSLCVLPDGTKGDEFFRVLRWMLGRKHDPSRRDMALKRARAALRFGVIADHEFSSAVIMIENSE